MNTHTPQTSSSHSSDLNLNAKLREKLAALAEWRIDPKTIIFDKESRSPNAEGGFATVYRATLVEVPENGSRSLSRVLTATYLPREAPSVLEVAVKKMKMKRAEERDKIFGLALREANLLINLSHRNVVPLLGFVEDMSCNEIWLVFPWAENGNLTHFIASADWEVPERVSLIDDVVRALEYLHTRDPPIYHGDLKSANILVNSEHRAVLTDFGSARRVKSPDLQPIETSPNDRDDPKEEEKVLEATFDGMNNTITLTKNNFTLRWAAPELLENEKGGTEGDIWSFGWVCYEVMTGTVPFADIRRDGAVILRICRGDLPNPSDHARLALIQRLGSLMVSCWSMDSQMRPTASKCRQRIGYVPKCVPYSSEPAGRVQAKSSLKRELGQMYLDQSDYPRASKSFREALELSQDAGDTEAEADTQRRLAHVLLLQSEYTEAAALYKKCFQTFQEVGDRNGKANALKGLADIHRLRRQFPEAAALYKECIPIFQQVGNRIGKGYALWGLAGVHRIQSEYTEAVALYKECIQTFEEVGGQRGKADALNELATVHRVQGQYPEAIAMYRECIQMFREIGDRNGKIHALRGLADVHRTQREYPEAVALYNECIQLFEELGDRSSKANILKEVAEVYLRQNQYPEAVPLYTESIQIFEELGDRNSKARTLKELAEIHLIQSQFFEVVPLYNECIQIFEELGDRNSKVSTLKELAEIHLMQSQYTETVPLYYECIRISQEIGDRKTEAYAIEGLADVYSVRREDDEAITMYSLAEEIFTQIGWTSDAERVLKRIESIRKPD